MATIEHLLDTSKSITMLSLKLQEVNGELDHIFFNTLKFDGNQSLCYTPMTSVSVIMFPVSEISTSVSIISLLPCVFLLVNMVM